MTAETLLPARKVAAGLDIVVEVVVKNADGEPLELTISARVGA